MKFLQVEVDLSRVAEELSGAFMELCDVERSRKWPCFSPTSSQIGAFVDFA